MINTFEGKRTIEIELLKHFNNFQIDIPTLIQTNKAIGEQDTYIILGNYICKINYQKSYQDPKQIWTKLSPKEEDIKKELSNIFWQRHKVAREVDIDFITQKDRDDITTLQAIV
ncbi:hypothetical protein GCM10011506_38380 [Marivirga lumbricoides]|uniref:Uncharacterized protein n=1 Tax=Marivirga lumbricoides TaxID=1046115 RepID=A0ABQ1MYD4_9BACT|nr:hypothetical protein GCM10011506_38380 [Marivirga lumbricoides]